MKLNQVGHLIYNKSGRVVALLSRTGEVIIKQKDFRRAVKQIREITNRLDLHFHIV